eukprot:150080-Chlamydomonas_euryale.AAC.1
MWEGRAERWSTEGGVWEGRAERWSTEGGVWEGRAEGGGWSMEGGLWRVDGDFRALSATLGLTLQFLSPLRDTGVPGATGGSLRWAWHLQLDP